MHDFKSLSYSKYADFQKCKAMAKALHLDKVPREESAALAKGIAVHDAAEQYFLKETKSDWLSDWFMKQLDSIRVYKDFRVEELWGCDWGFEPAKGPIWAKLDALCFLDDERTEALVVDYKTGKKYGNEVAHHQQGQLYALLAFKRYPTLERIEAQFWYVDHDIRTPSTIYTRVKDMARLVNKWKARFMELDVEDDYYTHPGWWCKWCPASPNCPDTTQI